MTNEDASYLLANADRTNFDEFMNKALDMAIKALEHEPRFILKSDGTIEQIHGFAEQMYKAGYEDGEKDTLKRSICKVIEAEKAYRDGFEKGYKAKMEEYEETNRLI